MRLVAVNDVIMVIKDHGEYKSTGGIILPEPLRSDNIMEIPAPYTGVIDSIGVPDGEYNVGDVVTMSNIERTSNGKIRGIIGGTQTKITIPKSEMLGRSALDFVGKDIEVELLRWDSNANAYNAKPKN